MSACLEPTPHNVAKIALLVGDLLFEFIIIEHEIANQDWSRNKSFDEQIKEVANHPLWIRELARQNNELQQLKDVKTLDRNFIEWLRTSFDNDDDSLIDLSSIQYKI